MFSPPPIPPPLPLPPGILVELTQLIEETCRQSNYLDMSRTINQNIDPDLKILGDRDALKQFLLIALANAFKHSMINIEIIASAEVSAV